MHILLILYFIFYVIWSCWGIWDDLKGSYSRWILLLNIFVSAFATVGLVCYILQIENQVLSKIWHGIFWGILLGEVGLFSLDFYDEYKDNTRKWPEALTGLVIALVLISPCLVANYLFAFGKSQ